MTGVAAIALCAAFTSCSKGGDELYDPDHGSKVIAATYEEAFRNVFGNPAPTQEWGFGNNAAKTRAINVNGNLWEEIPECTAEEAQAVFDYVNMTRAQMKEAGHEYTEKFPKNIQNYFVTQVWTGTDTYNNYENNGTPTTGSGHMDELSFAMDANAKLSGTIAGSRVGNWAHINNFNAASNRNYGGNTLVENGGTYDFAYNNSEDSKFHNKWIAIDGKNITDSKGVNHAGKYYICFDFIAWSDYSYTVFEVPELNNNKVNIPGAWHNVQEAIDAGFTTVTYDEYDWRTGSTVKKDITVGTNWKWTQVVQGNMCYPCNDVYTDWIVRVVEAVPANDPPIEENEETDWIRVFGEDLNANDPSDFDFNDVVIDIKITKTGAECILQAAGGTMPLRINGDNNLEVHKLFGVSTDVMVNTNAENTPDPGDPTKMMKGVSDKAAVPFTLTGKFNGIKSVKIEVNKGGWQELTAERGVPASKIGVPKDTAWSLERVSIKDTYPLFTDWVTTNTNYAGVWK